MATNSAMTESRPLMPPPGPRHHQRSKSSVLRSFIGHRRNNSDGTNLPSSFSLAAPPALEISLGTDPSNTDMRLPGYQRQAQPLGELQHNQVEQQAGPRSPKKTNDDTTPRSPTK